MNTKEVEHDNDNIAYQYELEKLEKSIRQSLKSSWEEDGPLHQNYKSVISMEIMECELGDDNDTGNGNDDGNGNGNDNDNIDDEKRSKLTKIQKERNKKIHQSATAAFQPTDSTHTTHTMDIDKVHGAIPAERNNPKPKVTKPKRRRIRVFFYNEYVSQVEDFMNSLEISRRSKAKIKTTTHRDGDDNDNNYNGGDRDHDHDDDCNDENIKATIIKSVYPCLISLKNIPAECIFPYQLGRSGRASDALLEHDYGRLAPYCICIGGNGKLGMSKGGHQDVISFHSDDSEIRFLPLKPEGNTQELKLCKDNISCSQVSLADDQDCVMAERFMSMVKLYKKRQKEEKDKQRKEERNVSDGGEKTGTTGIDQAASAASKASNDTTSPPRSSKKRKRKIAVDSNHTYQTLVRTLFKA
jgi:hypothetical protein